MVLSTLQPCAHQALLPQQKYLFLWVVVNHQGGFKMLRILSTIVLLALSMSVYAIGGPGTGGGAGFTPPPGLTLPPCVDTGTCTPADFANITPPPSFSTPPVNITPPPGVTIPSCVQTGTCTPADFAALLPPGFTPPGGGVPGGGFTPPPGVTFGPPGGPAAP